MMTSSSDELLEPGRRAGRRRRASEGGPRQATGDPRPLRADRPRHHHRPARPVRLRQDHADAQHRRHPDRRRRQRHGARTAGRIRSPCAAASATSRRTPTIYDDLRVVDNVRYFGVAVRHRRQGRRRGGLRRRAWTTIEQRCAAICPADSAPECRWPVRWWPHRICWCSTNPPSASTPCCASTCGSSSTNWPGAERPCSSRATSWTRPITAATCCSCATATCSPTPPRRKLREDTGCQSLEEAFLSIIRHSTAAAAS